MLCAQRHCLRVCERIYPHKMYSMIYVFLGCQTCGNHTVQKKNQFHVQYGSFWNIFWNNIAKPTPHSQDSADSRSELLACKTNTPQPRLRRFTVWTFGLQNQHPTAKTPPIHGLNFWQGFQADVPISQACTLPDRFWLEVQLIGFGWLIFKYLTYMGLYIDGIRGFGFWFVKKTSETRSLGSRAVLGWREVFGFAAQRRCLVACGFGWAWSGIFYVQFHDVQYCMSC